MPTKRQQNPVVILALSPAMAATALGIRPDEIAAGIASGDLPVFVKGNKRRVLVSDLIEWIEATWRRADAPTNS